MESDDNANSGVYDVQIELSRADATMNGMRSEHQKTGEYKFSYGTEKNWTDGDDEEFSVEIYFTTSLCRRRVT